MFKRMQREPAPDNIFSKSRGFFSIGIDDEQCVVKNGALASSPNRGAQADLLMRIMRALMRTVGTGLPPDIKRVQITNIRG